MLTAEASEEIKDIRVSPFSGQQKDWDEWSKMYQGIAAERGYSKVMLGSEDVRTDALDIDQKVENKYLIPEDERKQKHLARKQNQKDIETCRSLLPSCPFNLYLSQRHKSILMDQ